MGDFSARIPVTSHVTIPVSLLIIFYRTTHLRSVLQTRSLGVRQSKLTDAGIYSFGMGVASGKRAGLRAVRMHIEATQSTKGTE